MKNKPLIYALDDDSEMIELIDVLLKKLDVNFQGFIDHASFLTAIKNKLPQLCIVDLNLANLSGAGFQVISALRKKFDRNLRILILSGRSSPEDITFGLEKGANDYLQKPLNEKIFLEKVAHYLAIGVDAIHSRNTQFKEVINKATLSFGLEISEINEFGVTLFSKHFIKKQTPIILEGKYINDIFGVSSIRLIVHKNWIEHETKNCVLYCEFDTAVKEQHSNIRTWLANYDVNKTKKLKSP